MCGKAVTIVSAKDHRFELDVKALENLLGKKEIRDKNIVIVSVAGAFRKGKSFLLNFMLRYLGSKGNPLWLGDDEEPLDGFHWCGGSERDTTGILLWSKAFIVPLPSGDEVAVFLMDTQGSFDSSSTVKECATVFALSTMISSIQVYNLSQNIQEDDLQHLELFSEYGRLALENNQETPFQKLMFLVRDWSFPYDAPFGEIGGKYILDRRLKISEQQPSQLQDIRNHIRSCFSEVTCFLMPHPGLVAATDPDFNGKLSVIRPEFKEELKVLMEILLSPQNLLPKKIDGVYVKTKDIISYFKTYIKIFQGDELPEPKSILQATAEANNLAALSNAKDLYTNLMEVICGGSLPYVPNTVIERKHIEARYEALQQFLHCRKMGDQALCNSYFSKLQNVLDDKFNNYLKYNDSKRLVNAARTPGALLFLVILCYVNSSFLNLLGLESASSLNRFIMGICLIILSLWSYVRYSGEWQEIGAYIDIGVNFFWFSLVRPFFNRMKIMYPSSEVEIQGVAQNSLLTQIWNAFGSRAQGEQVAHRSR